MNPRERVLATINRQPVDRLPIDLWHTPEVGEMLRKHCGVDNDLDMYRALGLDKIVWGFMDYNEVTGEGLAARQGTGAENELTRSMWGVTLKNVEAGAAHFSEFGVAPLKGYDTPESLEYYPWWPDLDSIDYDGAATRTRELAKEFVTIGPWISLFEIYCQMRGLEQSMMDLIENPALVDAILDRIESIQSEMMRRFFARVGSALNLVFISDDIAGQTSLLMAPRLWQRHLQPRLQRWCELIHAHGLRVFYHTDGAARRLIGPILDAGVDILNPIQHACPGMDIAELKHEFGHRAIFHGGVENQFVLPRGTVADVRKETQYCLDTLGAGREGYICCSCHNVQAGTPLENILAMIETVQNQPAH